MLAQNFKSATDLGITDAELDALIKVLGMLERGELRHTPVKSHLRSLERPKQEVALFNMDHFYTRADCGTAACLAGTADLFFGTNFIQMSWGDYGLRLGLPHAARNLFAPRNIDEEQWSAITTDQAARALRSYLTTGEANWAEALAVQ